jgi:hypothetical protein
MIIIDRGNAKRKVRSFVKGDKGTTVGELRSGGRAFGTMIRLLRGPGIAWIAKQASLDFFMLQIEAEENGHTDIAEMLRKAGAAE